MYIQKTKDVFDSLVELVFFCVDGKCVGWRARVAPAKKCVAALGRFFPRTDRRQSSTWLSLSFVLSRAQVVP